MACGAELADASIVPERLAALMSHVAENLEAHARWVGVETPQAKAEHEGLAIELQRSFAELLLEHAEASVRVVASARAGSDER